MFGALLLDLDDTLFDRRAAFVRWAEATAMAQLGRGLEPAELAVLHELDGRGHRSREAFARDARERLGLAIDPGRIGLAIAEHVEPEPGSREALAALAETHRIAVVTNGGGAGQRAKLARLGLADVVHAVFVSGEVGIAKPAAGIFERALRWTEHAARDVLFVGDDPVIDLAPASAMGMVTAWRVRDVRWPDELVAPGHRIERVTDLVGVCA
ncbi:MAG: HAD family hydrolase [Deltaproteobacteria bacterium]|nr:HAD family hydrolase [Deltaproteobacteria bacterium]